MDKDMLDFFGIAPPLLCKYLPPERIDVLETQRVRFTPMLETNDRFEIRRTFEVALGQRADVHLAYAFAQTDMGKIAEQVATKMGRDAAELDLEQVRHFAMRLAREQIVPAFNKPENVEAFLMQIGGRACALSLSDDPFNPSMWDRYAAGWKGFVLFLDAASPFFRRDERGREIKPEKVRYRDTLDAELVTDVRAPLLTKLPVWSNEREWRLIVDSDNFPPSVDPETQRIADLRLRHVPSPAFAKVLLGPDSSEELKARCIALKDSQYPDLEIVRARIDRLAGTVSEQPVA